MSYSQIYIASSSKYGLRIDWKLGDAICISDRFRDGASTGCRFIWIVFELNGSLMPSCSGASETWHRLPAPRIIAVVVTYNRAILLRCCLEALHAQRRVPDGIVVIDDASPGTATSVAIAPFPKVCHVRHTTNLGAAAAYCTGIETALGLGAEFVWLMDDDAHPARNDCLEHLVALAEAGTDIAAPLVLDQEDSERLAFPIRWAGRTRFLAAELRNIRHIDGFAHLFNGALVRADVFHAIGLPDPRFVCRGDEVEFMLRARRAGIALRIETAAHVLHPSSRPEIHPILFGSFYATVPLAEQKRRLQFRNRGYIFRAYGMWHYLVADILRYGCHYLLRRNPDLPGLSRWLAATMTGWGGGFMRRPAPAREHVVLTATSSRPAPPALGGQIMATSVQTRRSRGQAHG